MRAGTLKCRAPPRAPVRPALLAPLGPLVVLALVGVAWARGVPHEVRAWDPWLPAAASFGGVLGPSLLARGRLPAASARAFVMGTLGALVVFALLAFFVPVGPGEASEARLYSVVDAVLGGALVALAALGIRPLLAVATWGVAALVLVRAVGSVRGSLATAYAPWIAEALVAAMFWLAAALLASALALVRFIRRGPRSIRG